MMLLNNATKHKRALSGLSESTYLNKQTNKLNVNLDQVKLNKEKEKSESKINSNLCLKPSTLNIKGKGSVIYSNLPLQMKDTTKKNKEMFSSRLDNSVLNNSTFSVRNPTPHKKFNPIKDDNKSSLKYTENNNKNFKSKLGHTRNLSDNGFLSNNKLSNFNFVTSNLEIKKLGNNNINNHVKKQNFIKNSSYAPKTDRESLNASKVSNVNYKVPFKSGSKSSFRSNTPLKGKAKANLNNNSSLENCNLSILSGISNTSNNKINNNGMNRTNSDFNKTYKQNNKSPLSSNSRHLSHNKFVIKPKINNSNNINNSISSSKILF